jgi:CheY-like chemotaxis protein
MLTGSVPFWADSPVAVAMKHVTEPIPDRLSKFSDIPPGLRAIVLKTLEKDKEQRFASADDLETELGLLDAGPLPAREVMAERLAGEEEIVDALENAFASIVLPRTVRGPASPLEMKAPDPPAPPLVLVVHDDVPDLRGAAAAIEAAGCRTLEVRNGQEALEAMMKSPVDLVFMDVDLPRIDGFDVTRILRSQAALASLPVLLTTGKFDRGQLAFAVQAGATDLLPRPFGVEVLGPRIWQILRHQGFEPPAEYLHDHEVQPTILGISRDSAPRKRL